MAYLSIVIPVYNVAEYIRQCITSVVSQADDTVEVVIVEDHSTDRSYEIVQEVAGKHDNVKVVRPERNFGLGEARNLGVAHSTGTYVAFLDSDDYFAPGAIRSILDRCRSTEADVIFYDYARLYWNNRKVRNKMGYLLGLHHDPIRLQDCPDLLKILNIAHNKAYKRSFLNENHLTFPTGYYEDVPFTYPVLCLADSIALLDRVCVMYRQRVKGSILRTADARHMQIIDQVDLLLERFDHDDRLEPWRDEIWDRSANHCVAVLAKGTERLPAELRNEFFDRASAVLAQHLPAQHEFPLNSQGLKYRFLVQGDYRSFQTLKLVNSYRVKIRNKYKPKIRRALKQARSSPLVLPTIDENLAVFTTMWGREPRGNPLAIAEGLKEWAPKVRAVWLLNQRAVDGLDGTPDYEYVTMGSDEHAKVMKAAKFFVNDVNFPNSLLKREGQVHLQTQHGTPLKFMGMDMQAYPVAANHMNFWKLLGRIKFWDFDLSSNRYSTEILARAFPGNHEILEFGYPRNDVLVNPPKGMASGVRSRLRVSDESFCVLYTPTYRDGYTEFDLDLDPEAVLGALGANATLLIRGHHSYRDTSSAERLTEEGRIIDVTDWPEVAPLYLASDLLICDYSSTMFDFAILGRPIVIYAPDWKRYRSTRGTYFDILEEPPGATAQSMEQLVGVLSDREFESDESQELLRLFRARFCEFDDGDATERVIKRVFLGEAPEPPVSRFDEPCALYMESDATGLRVACESRLPTSHYERSRIDMTDVRKDLPKKLDDVPGWLSYGDQLVFQWLLEWQSRTQEPSDLVEVGVYKGKSAIHLGRFLRDGERLTVCDLFDVAGSEETIRDDVRRAYASLSQDEFESNYLAFHDELPEIIRGLSSLITDHVSAGSCRLVHIDASHMYEHVRGDTFAAKEMLRQDGIVVFDDYRTEHTVGTAAAVWEAIANDGLNPIACTAMKLYATWGDPVPAQNEIRAQVSQRTDYKLDPVFVQRDLPVLRVVPAKKPRPAAAPASENSGELRKIAEEALAKATEALAKTSGGGRIERLARKVRARIKK